MLLPKSQLKVKNMALKEILSKTELFSGLDEKSLEELCLASRVRSFKKDGMILAQGDPCEGMALVIKGEVAIEIYDQEGDAVMVDLLDNGSCIGEELLFEDDSRFPYTVVSCSTSELCFFTKKAIVSLIDKNTQFQLCFFRLLSSGLLQKNRHIAILAQKSLRQKVCCFIRESLVSKDQNEVTLPASREMLAKYLAIPRPSFSRELALLCQEEILEVEGRKVRIKDRSRLEHIISEDDKESKNEDS